MHGIMGMKRCMRTCGAAATTAAGTQHRGADAEREQGVGRAVARQASGIPSRSMATILQREGGEKVGRMRFVDVLILVPHLPVGFEGRCHSAHPTHTIIVVCDGRLLCGGGVWGWVGGVGG